MASEIGALTQIRAFRNTDPPQLAEIWRSHSQERGLMQPMSMAALERYVFSKPTFDRDGLLVAIEDERIVGFAHAGFGPSDDRKTLSTDRGVVSLVMLRPDVDPPVANELLSRAEDYLRSHGARQIYGGGSYPLSPFYYGLYGGSEFSGVLDSDSAQTGIFQSHGFQPLERNVVLDRDLVGFRPVVDRQQVQLRRTTRVEAIIDPPTTGWWDAVMFEPFDRTRWELIERDSGALLASVYFWNLETMAGAWGVHAIGIVDLVVSAERRRRGLATFLLGEAFRQLQAQGVSLAEVHVPEANVAGISVFRNLGFEPVDASTLYGKL